MDFHVVSLYLTFQPDQVSVHCTKMMYDVCKCSMEGDTRFWLKTSVTLGIEMGAFSVQNRL